MKYKIKGFLGNVVQFDTIEEVDAWMQGSLDSLYAFAWSKDGTLYVGTTGSTHKEQRAFLLKQYYITTGKPYIK